MPAASTVKTNHWHSSSIIYYYFFSPNGLLFIFSFFSFFLGWSDLAVAAGCLLGGVPLNREMSAASGSGWEHFCMRWRAWAPSGGCYHLSRPMPLSSSPISHSGMHKMNQPMCLFRVCSGLWCEELRTRVMLVLRSFTCHPDSALWWSLWADLGLCVVHSLPFAYLEQQLTVSLLNMIS